MTTQQEKIEEEALSVAVWVTCSPHEWVWTHDQQVAMARYCNQAAARLHLYEWMTENACTVWETAQPPEGPRLWVVSDVDSEVIGKGETPDAALKNAMDNLSGNSGQSWICECGHPKTSHGTGCTDNCSQCDCEYFVPTS